MMGHFYGFSAPLMQQLFDNPDFDFPKLNTIGNEDRLVGNWISHLPDGIHEQILFSDHFKQMADSPMYNLTAHTATDWASPEQNTTHPACGAIGSFKRETFVFHQLKRFPEYQQIVDWYFKGAEIRPWLLNA